MSSLPTVNSKLVTVFGGSGFLGRHVVRALAAVGYQVRVACRRPDLAGFLQPMGGVGQIQFVQANLRYRWSIDRAVQGSDIVINLVGLLSERGKQTFESVQAKGAGQVAEAAQQAGARLIHISAIGADENSVADYARTKEEAEKLVRAAAPDAIILRPSVIFGPEDAFFNRFASIARMSLAMPLIGGGHTRLQPVYVGDVAQAVLRATEGKVPDGSVWELGGPDVLTFKQCLQQLLEVIDRKRKFLNLPFGISKALAGLLQWMPGAPLTPGQVDMLKTDNVVSDKAMSSGQTLEGMGITPTSLAVVLPSYLVRFRQHGQFEDERMEMERNL